MPVEKKYLHDIDLANNKLINPILNPLTTAQRTAVGTLLTLLDEGYVCFDTTQNIQYFWNGTNWVTVTATTAWGNITGILSNQIDLQNALNAKFDDPTGTTSQYIRGDGSLATFPTIPTVTPAALTKTDDTNVTLTLGGTPGTALLQSVSLTLGWTGKLDDSRINSANTWNAKQNALSGTGIVKSTAGTISYITDNSADWNTAYANRIASLTTTGSSGSSTLTGNTLNIPTYTLFGLGGEPAITAGTASQYWRGDKTWQTFPTIPTVGTWGALNYPTWTTGTPFVKMTGVGTFALDTNTYLTSAVTSIATSGLISGGTITNTGTISTSMNTNKLVGRSTAGTGVMEEITLGTGLSFSGTTLNATAGSVKSINVVSTNTPAGSASGTDYVYLVSGTTTITLPTPVGNTNLYTIKRIGTNTVSIATTSGTIDGSTSPITINVQYVSVDLISDGTDWFII